MGRFRAARGAVVRGVDDSKIERSNTRGPTEVTQDATATAAATATATSATAATTTTTTVIAATLRRRRRKVPCNRHRRH